MKKLLSIAFVGLAIVLTTASFSQAAAAGGHGPSGQPQGGHFDGHHDFDGHQGFDGRHDFDRRSHGGVFIGAPFGWAYPDYAYAPQAPTYWYYYCPSYGAYYPDAPSCPEAWVPVPAQ